MHVNHIPFPEFVSNEIHNFLFQHVQVWLWTKEWFL
jgi:hypothetical protein